MSRYLPPNGGRPQVDVGAVNRREARRLQGLRRGARRTPPARPAPPAGEATNPPDDERTDPHSGPSTEERP